MDQAIKVILEELKGIEHGFKHILAAGDEILSDKKINPFELSLLLLEDKSYQARMLAVYLLGQLSVNLPEAMQVLETAVATDGNWRVQEMLAKAFDHYCSSLGYELSLPKIKQWLSANNPNVKRAVIEGLRIWTGRPYFKEHPEVAIFLISQHRSHESEYLRKSVGNALRDISKRFPALVQNEISSWDLTDENVNYTKRLVEK